MIRKNNFLKIGILIFSVLFIVFFCGGIIRIEDIVYAEQTEKVYCTSTVEEDFCDDSIIIVLDKSISQYRGIPNSLEKKLQKVGALSITNLTELPENYVNLDGVINKENTPLLADYYTKVRFNQILQIKIEKSGKQNVLDIIKRIEKMEGVICAEPNMIYDDCAFLPDDVKFSEQWALNSLNDINIQSAWEITRGSKGIRVGIIDSGIAKHSDLNDNVLEGIDFYNGGTVTDDDLGGHGTHVAGIIGAIGNNGIGISGVAPKVSLVPLQTTQSSLGSGYSTTETRLKAIQYATELWDNVDKRISILNHSISGFGTSQAIAFAANNFPGLFVWAAGNDAKNIASFENVSSYELSNIISVGAINKDNERWINSNYGSKVDIYAPGEKIISTIPKNNYGNNSGTSMAAPHVTGVAALMLSINPNLTGNQLKEIIINNSDMIEISTPDGIQSVKKLNAYKAVDDIKFLYTAELQNGEAVLTGVREGMVLPKYVGIPSLVNINNLIYPVKEISERAFEGQTQCQDFFIPKTVVRVGKDAFKNTGMWNSTKNNSVVYTGFLGAEETGMRWAVGVKGQMAEGAQIKALTWGIADRAFYDQSNLKSITIPSRVIGKSAFSNKVTIYAAAEPGTFSTEIDEWTVNGLRIFWGCELDVLDTYVKSFFKTSDSMEGIYMMSNVSAPSRENYKFVGWYTNQEYAGVSYDEQQIFNAPEYITYYAKWIPNEYQITYRDVGNKEFSGIHQKNYPTTHTYGSITLLDSPMSTKQGYAFVGWYDNPNGTGSPITRLSATNYTSNITLYAKWVRTYTEGLKYKLLEDGSGYEVSMGTEKPDGQLIIPEDYNGLPVTKIADWGFEYCYDITSVFIPASVKKMGRYAFVSCRGITEVVFEDNSDLENIGKNAFAYCANLSSIVLPENLRTIDGQAFYRSNIKSITIPKNVISIGDNGFESCEKLEIINFFKDGKLESIGNGAFKSCKGLTTITIPRTVISIGIGILNSCENLENLSVAAENSVYESVGNCIIEKQNKVLVIGCNKSVIPGYVTGIKEKAFSGCNQLTDINIPDTVTDIGSYAFSDCRQLTSIILPDSITKISSGVFDGCNKLKDIKFPKNLTEIGTYSFAECYGLESITIPSTVRVINNRAFDRCVNLSNVTLSDGLITIGDSAFRGCINLTEITLPATLNKIGMGMFAECDNFQNIYVDTNNENYSSVNGILYDKMQTTLIYFPNGRTDGNTILKSITEIEAKAFSENTKLVHITIGRNITKIGDAAFKRCTALSELTFEFGSQLSEIGYDAFAECVSLKFFEIAENVERIGDMAFASCYNILDIKLPSNIKYMGAGVFAEWQKNQIIYLDDDIDFSDWSADWSFSCYAKIMTNSYTYGLEYTLIENDTAYEVSVGECSNLKEIVIPSHYNYLPVAKIADGGFFGCSSLEKVIIKGKQLNIIGLNAFRDCFELSYINIPESVTYICNGAFQNCNELNSMTMPYIEYIEAESLDGGCTLYLEKTSEPFIWNFPDLSNCSIIWNCTLSQDKTYVVSVECCENNIYYGMAEVPLREGYRFVGWGIEPEEFDSTIDDMNILFGGYYQDGTVLYTVWEEEYTEGLYFTLINNDTAYEVSINYFEEGTTILIPSTHRRLPVIKIADCGFAGINMERVIIKPGNLRIIGDEAFINCYALKYINIPRSVTRIGAYAFLHCDELKSITLPSIKIDIEDNSFEDLTIYTEDVYCDYEDDSFIYRTENINVIWGCKLSVDGSYVILLAYSSDNIYRLEIEPPYRAGYEFIGWSNDQMMGNIDDSWEEGELLDALWERVE